MTNRPNKLTEHEILKLLSALAKQRLSTVSMVEALYDCVRAMRTGNVHYSAKQLKDLKVFATKQLDESKRVSELYKSLTKGL